MLENDDVIFEATPRAPLAAVAIAAIAAPWIDPVSPELGAAAISDGICCVSDGATAGDAAGAGDGAADGRVSAAGGLASAAGDEVDHSDGAGEG
jgi:hypothetical protein